MFIILTGKRIVQVIHINILTFCNIYYILYIAIQLLPKCISVTMRLKALQDRPSFQMENNTEQNKSLSKKMNY